MTWPNGVFYRTHEGRGPRVAEKVVENSFRLMRYRIVTEFTARRGPITRG